MHSLFLSKIPINKPLQIPQQGPVERAAQLQGFFLHLSQIPYKNFPKERNVSLLSKALGKCPSMFPKRVAPVETDVHF